MLSQHTQKNPFIQIAWSTLRVIPRKQLLEFTFRFMIVASLTKQFPKHNSTCCSHNKAIIYICTTFLFYYFFLSQIQTRNSLSSMGIPESNKLLSFCTYMSISCQKIEQHILTRKPDSKAQTLISERNKIRKIFFI